MAVLILDTEALSALARPRSAPGRHERVRAAMRSAERRNEPVRVPSAVLVELYRGAGTDEAIDHVLGRGFARVVTTGVRIARIAGHLLAVAGGHSDLAIDALASCPSDWHLLWVPPGVNRWRAACTGPW